MRFQKPSQPNVGINIAPLVDVVFLLVIFFAVSTTFLETAGLQLELPESTSNAKREVRDVEVALDSQGRISLDGEALDREVLGARLRDTLDARERKVVILRADTHTEHGEVVRVMDLIRDAGAVGITVAARSEAP